MILNAILQSQNCIVQDEENHLSCNWGLITTRLEWVCYPAPKAPGNGVWRMANPVVPTLSPQRGLDQGDNKLHFLVVGRWQIALAKEFFEIIEK